MTPGSRSRILLVEDEPDIRETLAEVLQLDGHEVATAGTAEEGLARLQQARFGLLLTDYNLPGASGGWLVEEAQRQGLLAETGVLVVTAQAGLRLPPELEVLRKPLDVETFLGRVRRKLRRRAPAPLDLVLYVDAGTPASSRAVANLRALLDRFPESSVRLTVREATPAEHARLGGAPALVKRGPGPRALIFGTLDDAQPVLELLQLAGLVPAI